MAFPITARYFFHFSHTDTGLTPTFVYFKRTDTLAGVGAPSIVELQNGTYYFDFVFSLSTSPDIVFEIDGGAGLAAASRYISDTISPKDWSLDDAVSVVRGDISTLSGTTTASLAAVATQITDVADQLTRALGMLHENSVLDNTVYDGFNNLMAARLRLYDSKAHAQAPNSNVPFASYAIVATYTGSNLDTYTVTRET